MSRGKVSPYRFSFVSAGGVAHSREVFWERLYAFRFGDRPLLAAVRVVPHNDLLFATYLALKGKEKKPLHQKVLPGIKQTRDSTELVASITDLIPQRSTSLPLEIIERANQLLEESFERVMVDYGVADSLGQPSMSGTGSSKLRERFAAPTGGLGGLAPIEAEDVGWVYLSSRSR